MLFTEFVLSIGKVSMVGDNILTLYRAVNCHHLPCHLRSCV